jgi:hypothetical protein
MLTRLPAHARIVSPTPTDAYIEQRRLAISELVGEDLALETLIAFVEFSSFGLPQSLSKAQQSAVKSLYGAIQAHQPSFVDDVEATRMDLRLVATIALGELVATEPAGAISMHLAALLRSGTRLHPRPAEVHLSKLVDDLLRIANNVLASGASVLRSRGEIPTAHVKGSDAVSVGASATQQMNNLVQSLQNTLRADREELDVLWWAFGARSSRTGRRFDTLPVGERALTAATELCARMLMPPVASTPHLLGAVVADATEISCTQLVEQLSRESLEAFVEKQEIGATVLDSHATLLPVTWLCTRLLASDLSSGWQPEFLKKTKLDPSTTFPADTWALQFMDELVARRLSADLDKEEGAEEGE